MLMLKNIEVEIRGDRAVVYISARENDKNLNDTRFLAWSKELTEAEKIASAQEIGGFNHVSRTDGMA